MSVYHFQMENIQQRLTDTLFQHLANQRFMRFVLDSNNDAIAIFDSDKHLLYANPKLKGIASNQGSAIEEG